MHQLSASQCPLCLSGIYKIVFNTRITSDKLNLLILISHISINIALKALEFGFWNFEFGIWNLVFGSLPTLNPIF